LAHVPDVYPSLCESNETGLKCFKSKYVLTRTNTPRNRPERVYLTCHPSVDMTQVSLQSKDPSLSRGFLSKASYATGSSCYTCRSERKPKGKA
jgi:hypothetical protein